MFYWEHYIEKIDNLIHDALILNVRWSMENILARRDKPLVLLNISLHGKYVRSIEITIKQYSYTDV